MVSKRIWCNIETSDYNPKILSLAVLRDTYKLKNTPTAKSNAAHPAVIATIHAVSMPSTEFEAKVANIYYGSQSLKRTV
jgi:hypothetical protein